MDRKFLRKLLDECPVTDFTLEGNLDEREADFDKYLKDFTSFLYTNEHNLVRVFWEEYFINNQGLVLTQTPLLRRTLIFFDIAVAIYNYIAPKYIKSRKATESAKLLSVQLQYSFQMFKSIITLMMNGCYYSVISEYRTLYESFVISSYLLLHSELIPVYHDHAEFVNLKINKLSISFPKEQEEKYNKILEKYGTDFSKDFGWTKSVITNPKERKLITLANECKCERFFNNLYKVSCNFVHPSSLAATSKFGPEFIKPFIQVSILIIFKEMADFINQAKVVRKEAVILTNILHELLVDINHDFFEYQTKNLD